MILWWLYLIDGIVNVIGEILEIDKLIFFSKILLMPLLIAIVILKGKHLKWQWLIGLALFASWGGDVFLYFYARKGGAFFILGLISFLIGHLFYIGSFVKELSERQNYGIVRSIPSLVLPFLFYGIALMLYVLPTLSIEMKLPVFIYALVILSMAVLALNRKNLVSETSFKGVFIGAVLFVISDSMIAISNFVTPFDYSRGAIMSTYIAGQGFIVKGLLLNRSKASMK